MREILFRGQTRKRGEKVKMDGTPVDGNWVYGGIFPGSENRSIIYTSNPIDKFPVYSGTVGQFTGLADRNGTKIFEGDLLRGFEYPFLSDGRHNYYAEVLWFENSPAFGICTIKAQDAKVRGISAGNTDYMGEWEPAHWEVVGNIYDNPELLDKCV